MVLHSVASLSVCVASHTTELLLFFGDEIGDSVIFRHFILHYRTFGVILFLFVRPKFVFSAVSGT